MAFGGPQTIVWYTFFAPLEPPFAPITMTSPPVIMHTLLQRRNYSIWLVSLASGGDTFYNSEYWPSTSSMWRGRRPHLNWALGRKGVCIAGPGCDVSCIAAWAIQSVFLYGFGTVSDGKRCSVEMMASPGGTVTNLRGCSQGSHVRARASLRGAH